MAGLKDERRGNFFDAAASAVDGAWAKKGSLIDEQRLLTLFSVTDYNNAFTTTVRVTTPQPSYYMFIDLYFSFSADMSFRVLPDLAPLRASALVQKSSRKPGQQCEANVSSRDPIPVLTSSASLRCFNFDLYFYLALNIVFPLVTLERFA